MRLEKAPKVAVYIPPLKQPWDDAVMLAMEYAEIPYARVFDEEVLAGKLAEYDWLHLHHEDFTGQYGKFYSALPQHRLVPGRSARLRGTRAQAGLHQGVRGEEGGRRTRSATT